MGELLIRRREMHEQSEPLIPSIYQRVEYIENTGSSYLSCGYLPSGADLYTQAKYYKSAWRRKEEGIVYIRDNSLSGALLELAFSSGTQNLMFAWSGAIYTGGTSGYSAGITNSIIYGGVNEVITTYGYKSSRELLGSQANDKDYKAISVGRVGGTKYKSGLGTGTPSASFGGEMISLFANSNTGGILFVGRIYEVNIYIDEFDDSHKVSQMIPVYRKSDGEIGMWDTVRKQFFTNVGTGTFSKGADVN